MTFFPAIHIKSAALSKINWTQAIGAVAMLGAVFGLDLNADEQAKLVMGIGLVQGLVTYVLKTWFSPTITASSARVAGLVP